MANEWQTQEQRTDDLCIRAPIACRAARIHAQLIAQYGEPRLGAKDDPLSELVGTILSQNTADVNSHRAYAALRERFPTWDDVLAADVQAVSDAIHIGGLANIKAPRIQHILRQLYEERGSLDLSFLEQMPVAEARAYLTSLHGVGLKTASCVLLFALHQPVFPVDTHVHRVTIRLGLVPPKSSPEKVSALIEALIPPATYYAFHVNLIRHGRALCKAPRPRCEDCFLAHDCAYVNLSCRVMQA
jgi:endonuclease III